MQIYFTDAKQDNGFFSKIKVENGTTVTLTQKFTKDGQTRNTRMQSINGSLLPNINRLIRAQWDSGKNTWKVDATETQMSEWAEQLGAMDKNGHLITKVKFSNRIDPFITGEHCKVVIDDNYLLDTDTVKGLVHQAILRARNDIDFGDNELSQYDKKHNVKYKANKLGVKQESKSSYKDINEKMKFYSALKDTSLERKVMMLERLQVMIEGIPDEATVNEILDKKYNDEGNLRVGRKLDEMKTNRELIDTMMDMDLEDLEIIYYLHKAHRIKVFAYNSNYGYYEYDGVNIGRKLNEVEQRLNTTEYADILHKIINEVKNRERIIDTEMQKGKGKKK